MNNPVHRLEHAFIESDVVFFMSRTEDLSLHASPHNPKRVG